MKPILCASGAFVFVVGFFFAIAWFSGFNFQRGEGLGTLVCLSLGIAGIVSGMIFYELRR